MTTDRRTARPAGLVLALVIAFSACATLKTPTAEAPPAANPNEGFLYANLYMQTAAEYEAVCLQTYVWAAERLKAKLAALPKDGLPPAVVMDLDETVFDNGGYFAFIDREKMPRSGAAWDEWEKTYARETSLVPGAKAFIEEAERLGVAVVYISNRNVRLREYSVSALQRAGVSARDLDRRLMLQETVSDKTERRRKAESMYRVVLWIGDNLRDFSDEFAAPGRLETEADRAGAIAARKEAVRGSASRWGDDWIILPNPVYGEWLKPLGPDPRRFLRETGMRK